MVISSSFFALAAWVYAEFGLCPSVVDLSSDFIVLRTVASVSEPHGLDKIFTTWSAGKLLLLNLSSMVKYIELCLLCRPL